MKLSESDLLEPSLAGQGRLSRWLLEKALEAGIATTPAWWVIGAFTSHLLLSASIL